jgi:hypothetical protein
LATKKQVFGCSCPPLFSNTFLQNSSGRKGRPLP